MNIQDLLSGIKTAATSNTGKAVLSSLAGAAIAGRVGGAPAIRSLSGIVDRLSTDRKNRNLEDIRKAKEKLTAERDAVIDERNREDLLGQKLRNEKMQREAMFGKKREAFLDPSPDKFGKMTPFDVAIEPKIARVKSGLRDLKLPDTVPAMMTNPALNPNERSLESAQDTEVKTGSQYAADFVSRAKLKGLGEKTRKDLQPDFKATMEGLSKGQQRAAGRAFAEEVAPGFAERTQATIDANSGLRNRDLPTSAAKTFAVMVAALVAGAKGATAGFTYGGPWGAGIAGTVSAIAAAGATAATTDAAIEYFDGQASATNTPAVAGADKTAAEDIAYGENSSISPEARDLIQRLKETMIPQNFNSVLSQLDSLSDFADLTAEERQGIKRVLFQKFSEREQQPQNVSGDMARMSQAPGGLTSAYRPMSR